jgi:ABC-type phosphate transport system substrate-binding protein
MTGTAIAMEASMKSWREYSALLIALSWCGTPQSALAQLVYAGGDTGPAPVYRQLMDCHSVQVDGNPPGPTWPTGFQAAYPISPKCASSTGDSSGLMMQMLYAPVGSGAAKRALINHDASSANTGLGVPSSNNNVPFVSTFQPSYGYPNLQYIGSDDPWNARDAADYVASGNTSKYGNIIQIPSMAQAVVIVKNGYNCVGTGSPGAERDKYTFGYPGCYTKWNLTRKALCGIFTGHITRWNDPAILADDLPITVVHRSDGSGTTSLLANALREQCKGITGPINTADALSATPHVRSWEFQFSDHSNAACPDHFYGASNTIDWPDLSPLAIDGCGNTLLPPPDTHFVGANGDAGVKRAVEANIAAIGYSTMPYAQPVLATGMIVVNIQSQYDLDNNTGAFQWPSPNTIANAMASVRPIFPDANARANPLNWSSQAQVSNPATPNSYPIVGFTWFDLYQCYDPTRAGGGTFTNLQNYLAFHYYDPHAPAIIVSAGFAPIPDVWRDEIAPLLTSGPSQMGLGGDPSVGCGLKSGG